MIVSLEGKVALRAEKHIVLEVNKIGYRIIVGQETAKRVPPVGSNLKIFTYHYQYEDKSGHREELYGFLTMAELEFFEILNTISGVGPKSALGIIDKGSVDNLKQAIAAEDIHYLTKVFGLGQKKAEKIVLELKSKLGQGGDGSSYGLKEDRDVIDALVSLGYNLGEAREVLKKLTKQKDPNEKIKQALKILGGRQ